MESRQPGDDGQDSASHEDSAASSPTREDSPEAQPQSPDGSERLLGCLMRGRRATEGIYSATQLWWFPVIMVGVLAYVVFTHHYEEVSVVVVEGSAIIIAASLSSFNYTATIRRIAIWASTSSNDSTRNVDSLAVLTERTFRILNMAAFMLAVVTIYHPTVHLFTVECVYALFCLNNTIQGFTVVRRYGRDQLIRPDSSARRDRAIELRKWLSEENGPAIIAYTAILLLFCALDHVPDIVLGFHGLAARDAVLRGLAAGAAGFHLTVSTFKYRNWQRVSADIYNLSPVGHEQQAELLLRDAEDRRWMRRIAGLVTFSGALLSINFALDRLLPLIMPH